MRHETSLIATIAIGLSAASVGGLIAARLHLPRIVGCSRAGVAAGPFTPRFGALLSITINRCCFAASARWKRGVRARPALAGLVEGRKAKTL